MKLSKYDVCITFRDIVFVTACLRIVRAKSSVVSGSSQQPMARLLSSSSGKAMKQLNRSGNLQSPVSIGHCNGTANSFRNIKVRLCVACN